MEGMDKPIRMGAPLIFHFSSRCFTIDRVTEKKTRMRWLLSMLLCFGLASCARDEGSGSEGETLVATDIAPVEPAPTIETVGTINPTATVTAQPTPTSAPDLLLAVADQELADDGQLTVDRIVVPDKGWLVIRTDEGGQAGDVLAYVALPAGESEGVTVSIEPILGIEILHASIHLDEGRQGEFEFPGPDAPQRSGGEIVDERFRVESVAPVPSLVVEDQDVSEDGVVKVAEVVSPGPGYLALHNDDNGDPGRMLAFAPVQRGLNVSLTLTINWQEATPELFAILYEDDGVVDNFEYPQVDRPIIVEDQPVAQSFDIFMPPDVFVIDQPIVNDEVVVERVVAYGPSWLVIYSDDEGGLGTAIGWAPLTAGVNEEIVVPLAGSPTSLLHIMIHEDADDIGEFEFPRTDVPLSYRDRVPNPFSFRTDTGNYLIAQDQAVGGDGKVTVPLVVTDVPVWVVLEAVNDDESIEILGQVLVAAGVTRRAEIQIETEGISSDGQLTYAGLYWDSGQRSIFEYPDGPDLPMTHDSRLIQVPFILSANDEEL